MPDATRLERLWSRRAFQQPELNRHWRQVHLEPSRLWDVNDVSDVLWQVEQVGHDFYLFRDKYTNQVRVLYKRKHSGYGVIVPQLDD